MQKLQNTLLTLQSHPHSADPEPTPRRRGPVYPLNPDGEVKRGRPEDRPWPRSTSPGVA